MGTCRMSPDGTRILFSAWHDAYEVWKLDNAVPKNLTLSSKSK
jgi:hypothetical protein